MNHHDDQLRQLLNELADDAPLALGRKEAVMSKVSRRIQRQMAVRGVAALVVAVGLGLGAAGTVQQIQKTGSDSHHDETTLTQPTHEPSHDPTAPPVTSEPTQEPTHGPAPAPAQEPTQEPSHEPTHATTADGGSQPTPENTEASGPLTVTAVMDPSSVAAGDTATAVVTARDGEGRLLDVDIDWGDGTTPFHFSPGDAACPRTTHLDGRFTHKYTTARSTPYPVHVTITSGDCAATEKVTVETHVTVTGGDASPTSTETNGPSMPTGAASSQTTGDNASYVYLHAVGSDSDGFVRRMVVTWGDGTTTLVGEWSTAGCTDAPGTNHPTSSSREATRDSNNNSLSHHFSTAGDHTVTVEVDSVACDGTHQQVTNSAITVTQAA